MKKRIIILVFTIIIMLGAFSVTAMADNDEIIMIGIIHESDGTPAEVKKYVISITSDKLPCINGTDGYIRLMPHFSNEKQILTVKKDNAEVATANINLIRGNEYSFTSTESSINIVVPTSMEEINLDLIIDNDEMMIEEVHKDMITTNNNNQRNNANALLYILVSGVISIVTITIIIINKKA